MNSPTRRQCETRKEDRWEGTPPHLVGGPIDHVPGLLEQSYRLRYRVYCLERRFLPADRYPAGLESDRFDDHSLHVGAVNHSGELVGTARAVKVTDRGLPVFDYCTPFAHETEFHRANTRLVEVGRLAVDRRYLRRWRDTLSGMGITSRPDTAGELRAGERRRVGTDALMTVLQALFQETRRIGATHWLAAMEEPLRSRLAGQGLPFRAFGPACDYYGPVVPYQMALREFETVIESGRFPGLQGFLADAEPAPGTQRREHARVESEHTRRPQTLAAEEGR
jgi:N-acyl amino acid synthase of PEP-CTERM/exosortase system